MKTKLLITILGFANILYVNGQSLNPTSNISVAGSVDTFKGGYTFAYATSGTPWNGSLISYGGFPPNNYDTQISSDYGPNGGNHISYRTRNGDTQTWNPWYELATRGTNTFNGTQLFTNGNVGIGVVSPSMKLEVVGNENLNFDAAGFFNTKSYGNENDKCETRINIGKIEGNVKQSMGAIGAFPTNNTDSSNGILAFYTRESQSVLERLRIIANGNVGIGMVNPKNKLDVNGTIHSKEVKVDMNGWSDFVFKKDYSLPTLQEVEKHISEKGHLENIPSEDEVLKNGINIGEMNSKLLQKIEELTLYAIEQEKNTQKLTQIIEELTKRLEAVEKQ